MNLTHFLPLAILTLGCGAETMATGPTIEIGDHIDVIIDEGLEPCGDLAEHMDRFIELAAASWDVDISKHRYTFHWYEQSAFGQDAGCPEGSLGCASGSLARSYAAPVDHELVHLITAEVGRPPSFFLEGAAVAFELPVTFDMELPGEASVEELIAATHLPFSSYVVAGAFTRFLIDRHGMADYRGFYASLNSTDGLPEVRATHAAVFGEPLSATIAAFNTERRDCEQDRFRFKLIECASVPILWETDSLTMRRTMSCDEDGVIGPFWFREQARSFATFEVEKPAVYEFSVIGDDGGTITVGSCGGCEAEPPQTSSNAVGPRNIRLGAGRHYLQFTTGVTGTTALSLRLQKVADLP